MTPEQITIVQSTFAQIRPMAEAAAALFYTRLFTLDASLRSLFKSNMQQQGVMLMRMLALAIDSLHCPDALLPTLQALGQRHAGYGVRAQHYETVGAALLWTLEQALAEQWTVETCAAWSAAYTLLASAMQMATEAELAMASPACASARRAPLATPVLLEAH